MQFSIRLRNIIYIATVVAAVWFFFAYHTIFTPFLIAMIFAYVFNPLIDFLQKLKIPRSASILIVYVILITSFAGVIILLTQSILAESENIRRSFDAFSSSLVSLQNGMLGTPGLIRSLFTDYVGNVKTQIPGTISFPFFTRAFSEILNVFIFLFAAFFFLKDGRKMVNHAVNMLPSEYVEEAEILLKKINTVLSSYLRGQIILIIAMMVMLYAIFSVLGVKNALTLSLMSALFEIVPIIGPIVAGALGTFVIVISGGIGNFQVPLFETVLILVGIYAITRYIQDYGIAPFVIGRATELHPLLILFSVIAGERLYGILGVILAVPVAASLRIIYSFLFEKIYKKK
ncbi:MAG: AI-2E family transporter [Candidatus Levyibacteriota bacterium]